MNIQLLQTFGYRETIFVPDVAWMQDLTLAKPLHISTQVITARYELDMYKGVPLWCTQW